MWQVGWIGISIFAMYAICAVIALASRFRRLGKIFAAEPAPLDRLPSSGPVVVRGKVAAASATEPLLVAPFSRRGAARMEVQVGPKKSTKKGVRILDAKLETKAGTRFALEDGAGHRVLVAGEDPAVLDVPPEEGDATEQAMRAFLTANGKQASDFEDTLQDPTWEELAIYEGADVHAMGELAAQGEHGAPVLRAPAGGSLVLTTENRESYRQLWVALKWTTIVFGVICGVMVLIGLIGAQTETAGGG